MKLFPGIKAKMGRWTYYVVKMNMRDIAGSVLFASEGYDSPTLNSALQRELDYSRAKKEIVTYLCRQEDRFFNSIVIAAIGGEPKWWPIQIEDDPKYELLRDDIGITDSFGVLRFTGQERYYALDGQHRLKAIKELVDPSKDAYQNKPADFELEEISVVLVVPGAAETDEVFRERFRRLFGNLNRYAKPMDQATNIIMDEDDVIAIVTRRLFSDHPFFRTIGPQRDSKVVDTTKGKNMTSSSAHFTKLEVLYEMNEILLSTNMRGNSGWDQDGSNLREFKRFRPDDAVINSLYTELATCWDAILTEIPDIQAEPIKMRNHHVIDNEDRGDERDSLLFWPIGQIFFADLVRFQIDNCGTFKLGNPSSISPCLQALSELPWDLDALPWRNLILVPPSVPGSGNWRMRSEQRKEAMNVAKSLFTVALLRRDQASIKDPSLLESIKKKWLELLVPAMPPEETDLMWDSILKTLRLP